MQNIEILKAAGIDNLSRNVRKDGAENLEKTLSEIFDL